jgi:hypothetical protein
MEDDSRPRNVTCAFFNSTSPRTCIRQGSSSSPDTHACMRRRQRPGIPGCPVRRCRARPKSSAPSRGTAPRPCRRTAQGAARGPPAMAWVRGAAGAADRSLTTTRSAPASRADSARPSSCCWRTAHRSSKIHRFRGSRKQRARARGPTARRSALSWPSHGFIVACHPLHASASASAVPSHPTASQASSERAARSCGKFEGGSGDTVKGFHTRGGAHVHRLSGCTLSTGSAARLAGAVRRRLTERQAPPR